ncbi:hypothetical protein BJ508DRAFT_302384 [Ascobolus immersus RN42]|uniref:Uncharacterized protein n=1 Tax=Ascobolus immersus RN42 TaxID=1160509 RepID=A0A3N4IIP4_ASCIM|nr:hypothetical protein BJ508DRAFT_302384 [Ascobolus immersus RN42]
MIHEDHNGDVARARRVGSDYIQQVVSRTFTGNTGSCGFKIAYCIKTSCRNENVLDLSNNTQFQVRFYTRQPNYLSNRTIIYLIQVDIRDDVVATEARGNHNLFKEALTADLREYLNKDSSRVDRQICESNAKSKGRSTLAQQKEILHRFDDIY